MLEKVDVARIGKAVGLKGELKLHLFTDFPEQFKKGAKFSTKRGSLTIEYYDSKRGVVKFEGVDTPEDAKRLTNLLLSTTEEQTRKNCQLDEGEFFWFDIIGCEVFENGVRLGKVKDIHRFPGGDYLEIKTDDALVEKGHPKSFLVPFLDRYIKDVNISEERIESSGAMEILEAS
ncbi:ribosome maturation factor RimM [Nitrosophilus alvini]|uniref:ribosome maturation factor RimM n=1 Tax=Nitrosophilus alvini TaxID=2714855 RepID=UPI001EEB03AD|nr:ribosome maturation factor RimM [Nitrosophilus alvini]